MAPLKGGRFFSFLFLSLCEIPQGEEGSEKMPLQRLFLEARPAREMGLGRRCCGARGRLAASGELRLGPRCIFNLCLVQMQSVTWIWGGRCGSGGCQLCGDGEQEELHFHHCQPRESPGDGEGRGCAGLSHTVLDSRKWRCFPVAIPGSCPYVL